MCETMIPKRIIFRSPQQKERAQAVIESLPFVDGTPWAVQFFVFDEKSRAQEEKYHAMIGDIARQVEWVGKKRDTETWKRLLIEAFVNVMREEARSTGGKDPFNGHGGVIPSLDGQRVVQLGIQSRRFGKRMAADFIEYLYAYGSEQGVIWSDRGLA